MREPLGLDGREWTPTAVLKMAVSAAETRSFARAAQVMEHVAGIEVSAKTIERVSDDVGQELAGRRDADPKSDEALAQRPEAPPEMAVVECDGGRIRTREPGRGPGVHLSGQGWRETKNACLIRAQGEQYQEDPAPEPPPCFCDPEHVAKMAETEGLSTAAPVERETAEQTEGASAEQVSVGYGPKRLVRTVLSSLACSDDFGDQMAREAKRRRFGQAKAKAFVGDGLAWNWSIWKSHFREYTPILDFIHVLSYLFVAAKAVHGKPADAWDQYLAWMRGCWRGEADQVLEELRVWRRKLGDPPADAAEQDPRKIVARTITYLTNNRGRMRYPAYRRSGLPVTTAWMESLVKEMNFRVKGTEMFWNDPDGAERILQIRAAALSEDDRLVRHVRTRPGCPFTRRPKAARSSAEKIKS